MNRQNWSRGLQALGLVALALGLWSCAAVSARAIEANAAEAAASPAQDPQAPPGAEAEPGSAAKPDNPAKPKLPVVEWQPVADVGAVKKAADRGANFLIDNRRPNGAYGTYIDDVGITALVVQALATCPRAYREDDGPFISNAIDYLLAKQKENGGFYNAGQGLENYKTSVTLLALTALDAGRDKPRYTKAIERAREYLMTLQSSEDNGYDSEKHKKAYGGIGYGSDRRPDLSNTQFAIEALRAAGISEDSDVFKRALVFLKRCQNAEGNDLFGEESGAKSTGDGGMMYSPGSTKAETVENPDGTVSYTSYGSMTYAGIKSYVYAGLTKDDPLVQQAWAWIQKNYTVEENPGMATPLNPARGWNGLFYYYMVMARTLDVLDVDVVKTPDGVERNWAAELAGRLIALQREDGSWINPVDRWWEGDPAVTTAYAVRALAICHERLSAKK